MNRKCPECKAIDGMTPVSALPLVVIMGRNLHPNAYMCQYCHYSADLERYLRDHAPDLKGIRRELDIKERMKRDDAAINE